MAEEPREGNAQLGRHCGKALLLLPLWPYWVATYWIKKGWQR